jgi:hypothetical protein
VPKKKNKNGSTTAPPNNESLPSTPTPAMSELPAVTDERSATNDRAGPLQEPGPDLMPAGKHAENAVDLVLSDPPGSPSPPVARLAPELEVGPLLDRIRRLEDSLAQVLDLQSIEQRVAERVTTQLQREKPQPPGESPVLSRAAALLDAGKNLMPVLTLPAPVTTLQPGATPPADSTSAERIWLAWDVIADARAIFRMFVDPRYSMSWFGRLVPVGLLVAFVTTYYWVPLAAVPVLGFFIEKPVQILVGFLLFKVLSHEARRYRQTAPDLPPSLRL